MTGHGGDQVEEYAQAVVSRMTASRHERTRIHAELVGHLADARDAGELDQVLRRLGSPAAAAASLAPDQPVVLASLPRRLAAAAVDNLPLMWFTVALLVDDLHRGGTMSVAFPPVVRVRIADVCLGPLSVTVGEPCSVADSGGGLYGGGLAAALLWSVVALGMAESRFATSPGKALMRLRVQTDVALRLGAGAAVVRRLSFLLGPLAWLDWVPFCVGHRRRLLDQLVGARVVEAPRW